MAHLQFYGLLLLSQYATLATVYARTSFGQRSKVTTQTTLH